MACVDLGHSAAADELTDLVTPAQQARCAVHDLPFFLPLSLPLPGVGWLGTDEATTGAVALELEVDVREVVAVAEVVGVVLAAPSPLAWDMITKARTPSTAAAVPRSQAER
jgi:hypothetical protein